MELPNQLRRRVVIDRVGPEVDGGRFAVKRIRGDEVVVEADIICDGHEELDCRLHVRHGETGYVTPDPDRFAQHAISLLTDDALWRAQQAAAVALQRGRGWAEAAGDFEGLLAPDVPEIRR